jgi:serine/threonine-protein phosphatase 2A regulatory subunit B
MHPNSDSLIVVGMSKGSLKISDMRQSSSFDSNSTCLKMGSGSKNYLIDLISNISSAEFTQNGKYIVSRDYLTVKIWDVANTKKPVNTVILHEGLKSKLSEMVDN